MANSQLSTHIVEHNGVQYFSPNCVRPNAITSVGPVEDNNPFKPGGERRSTVRYQNLLHPCIWQKAFYWTAFIPMEHWYKTYRHPPFNTLAYTPPIVWNHDVVDPLYSIPEDNELTRLETEIYRAVVALKNNFELPCVLPFLPNTRSYQASFRNRAQLLHALEEARAWFSVWLGALSYCLAMAQTREVQTRGLNFTGYPSWRKVLKEEGLLDAWIDDILRSPVGNFGFTVPRVGCILKTEDAHPDQPPQEWFMNYDVPIWYRWGGDAPGDTVAYQRSTTVGREDTPVDSHADLCGMEPGTKTPREDTGMDMHPSWRTFLDHRMAKHEEMLAKETAIEKERREIRARQKPVETARVFEWIEDRNDPLMWRKESITQRCKQDVLALYSSTQLFYDPFFNEWHCCSAFTFSADDAGTDDEEDFENYNPRAPRGSSTCASTVEDDTTHGDIAQPLVSPRNGDDCVGEITTSDQVSPDAFTEGEVYRIQQEVEEVFGGYYGFCPPVPTFTAPEVNPNCRTVDWFRRLLGSGRDEYTGDELNYFRTEHYRGVQLFVDGVVGEGEMKKELYDTQDESLRPVRFLPRFSQFQLHNVPPTVKDEECLDDNSILYVFAPMHPTVVWRLAVFSAICALFICRLPPQWDEQTIVFHLCQRGIQFRLLHPESRIRRPMAMPVTYTLPVRPWEHEFTKVDYESYVNERTFLLGQPHMQAMLRRGGMVWRLAIGVLGLAEVAKEPTLWGHQYSPLPGYVEDTVSTREMDILCGAYECVTDDGKKKALKSWWPLVRYYEKEECGVNHGHWSNRRETWFQERLQAIQNGDSKPQPLSYTAWKSKLHGVKGVRAFLKSVTRSATTVLTDHATRGGTS